MTWTMNRKFEFWHASRYQNSDFTLSNLGEYVDPVVHGRFQCWLEATKDALPVWLQFDGDCVIIHGIRYSHDLLQHFGEALPIGEPFMLDAREPDGALTVLRLDRTVWPIALEAPAASTASINSDPQFGKLLREWRGLSPVTISAREYSAIINYCDRFVSAALETARRDMHETNVTVLTRALNAEAKLAAMHAGEQRVSAPEDKRPGAAAILYRNAALEEAASIVEGQICSCCFSEDAQHFAEHVADTIRAAAWDASPTSTAQGAPSELSFKNKTVPGAIPGHHPVCTGKGVNPFCPMCRADATSEEGLAHG